MISKIKAFCHWEIDRISLNILRDDGQFTPVDITRDHAVELAQQLMDSVRSYDDLEEKLKQDELKARELMAIPVSIPTIDLSMCRMCGNRSAETSFGWCIRCAGEWDR